MVELHPTRQAHRVSRHNEDGSDGD
jgi:hypothetical protein